jgi:hypothetical protein
MVNEGGKEEALKSGTRKRRRQRTQQQDWWTEEAKQIVEDDIERAVKRAARAEGDFVCSSPSAGEEN